MAPNFMQTATRDRGHVFSATLLLIAAQCAFADGTAFFSSAQVSQGRWEFSQKCAVCHCAQLQGGGAPAL